MRYYIRYELQVEAENYKKLLQKLSLVDNQVKMKDRRYTREIVDEQGWYVSPINKETNTEK